MAEKQKKHYHRGRRKKNRFKDILYGIIFIIAIGVFIYSGFQLFTIFKGYHEGEEEYESLAQQVISIHNTKEAKGDERFIVDFDKLSEMNSDVVGWIRFEEPAVISYPLVYGDNNDEYLYKTFQGYDNTVGSIFVNAYNNPDFEDQSTIIYGHRMYNGTMFDKLGEYEKKEFWENNPYFYIYTPDNTEMRYQIYSVGIVKETSDLYLLDGIEIDDFENYIELSKECSFYETGVEVTEEDKLVLLSTCTNADETERLIIIGVRESITPIRE